MKRVISLQKGWQTEIISGGAINFDLPLILPAENIKGAITFKNKFTVPDKDDNEIYYLNLSYLSGACAILIDGKKVCTHNGMFAPFACDLTGHIKKNAVHEICVSLTPAETPSGHFTFGSASVICVSKSRFDYTAPASMPLTVRTEIEGKLINIYADARIIQPNNYDILKYRLLGPDGKTIISQTVKPTSPQVCFTLPAAMLWEGGNDPFTYTLSASLLRDNEHIDDIETSFGIRDIRITENGFFSLNGIHLPLCGVSISAAHSRTSDCTDLADLGANCVMIDSLFPGEDFLYTCDQLGLLVFMMLPYSQLPGGREELVAVIRMLSVHPCVCFFGFRAQDVNLAKSFTSAVHAARTDVLTVGSTEVLYQESFTDDLSDILLIDVDFDTTSASQTEFENRFLSACSDHPDYRFAVFAKLPLALLAEPGEKGYPSAERSLCDWHEKLWNLFNNKRNVIAYFTGELYDDATDYTPGLISGDREERKDCFWFYRSQFSAQPTLHICDADTVRAHKKKLTLKCYTNLHHPRLYLRGREQKKLSCDQIDEHVFLFRDLKLRRGNNIIAVLSSETDTADSTVIFRK